MGDTASLRLGALILAAGLSSRMGSSKALLDAGGEVALARIFRLARAAGCSRMVVVLRSEQQEEADMARGAGATVVTNPHPEEGMFSSVRLGLEPAAASGEWTLLWPVDFSLVAESTIHRLTAVAESAADHDAVQPARRGRGGHPILLAPHAAGRILAAPPTSTLRDLLAPERRLRVEVDDPLVTHQANSAEEWQRALRLRDDRDHGPPG